MKKYLKPIVLAGALAFSQHLSPGQTSSVPLPPGYRPEVAEYQKQVEIGHQQQFDAQNAFRDAQNSLAVLSMDGMPGRGGSFAGGSLIIPKETADSKNFAELEEDLAVMSRILDKAAGPDDKSKNVMGITLHRKISPGSTVPRILYIEGYGALFFLNVNFSLLPPPVEKAEAQPKPETSSEWEETRRELSNPQVFTFNVLAPGSDPWTVNGPVEEYDADKVEELKRDLVAALKNAAHIRKLKSDEFVTVIVSGRGNNSGAKLPPRTIRRADSRSVPTAPQPPPPPSLTRETKLIVRARRSDIEAFQKDKIAVEEFRKKTSVILY